MPVSVAVGTTVHLATPRMSKHRIRSAKQTITVTVPRRLGAPASTPVTC
jgi:hypothetical protein